MPRAAYDRVRRQRSEVREQTSGIRQFFPCRNLTSSPQTIIPGKRLNHFSFGSSKRVTRHKTKRSRAVLQLPPPLFQEYARPPPLQLRRGKLGRAGSLILFSQVSVPIDDAVPVIAARSQSLTRIPATDR